MFDGTKLTIISDVDISILFFLQFFFFFLMFSQILSNMKIRFVGNFAFLFNCTPLGRTSDSMMDPTYLLMRW